MKKIVTGIAAIAMAASMFAVDFAARVYMTGNVADGTIDITDDAKKSNAVNFWKLNKQDQKDADALVMSVNGDQSGAAFQFWYNYDGSGSTDLVLRSTNLWFKPIDALKITIGDVDVGTYKEMIDWWKVAVGNSATEHNNWGTGGQYSSAATVTGSGISAEYTPIDGLWLSAGIAAGAGNNFAEIAQGADASVSAYGAAVKYNFSGLIDLPLSAAISWRDSGKGAYKILAIGADYGSAFGAGFYGMLNVRLFFDAFSYKTVTTVGTDLYTYSWDVNCMLKGIAFDNYFKYSVGAFNIAARLPVTLRGICKEVVADGKKASDYGYDFTDPSYMCYEIKATYAMDGCTLYLDIENDHAVTFDDSFLSTFLNMNVQPGVTLNVGTCALDLGLNVTVPNSKTANLAWAIPFTASVAF